MSEQDKALITRWFKEAWGDGNAATIDELSYPQGHAYGFPNPKNWKGTRSRVPINRHAAGVTALPKASL
jgi:hypothetical protein